MPVNFASDTKAALGEFARECESRSLLQQRFIFFDDRFDETRRLALDRWVSAGCADVQSVGNTARLEAERIERRDGVGDQRARARRGVEALCNRMTEGFPKWITYPPPRAWLSLLAEDRKREFSLQNSQSIAIGLANGIPENGGLTLHRRYGYPYIPGSALKGLAADAAREFNASDSLRLAVLGEANDARRGGAVSFLDAPSSDARVTLDIVTPHYSDYYSGSSNHAAEEIENPKPNVFPVVGRDATFRFTLLIRSARISHLFTARELLDAAEQWLRHALQTFGAGAKTRSGYGRFGEPEATGNHDALFPDLPKTRIVQQSSSPPVALTPVESCVCIWRGKANLFTAKKIPSDLVVLTDQELLTALRQIIPSTFLTALGTPANPETNPFWIEFVKGEHGAAVLARLQRLAR